MIFTLSALKISFFISCFSLKILFASAHCPTYNNQHNERKEMTTQTETDEHKLPLSRTTEWTKKSFPLTRITGETTLVDLYLANHAMPNTPNERERDVTIGILQHNAKNGKKDFWVGRIPSKAIHFVNDGKAIIACFLSGSTDINLQYTSLDSSDPLSLLFSESSLKNTNDEFDSIVEKIQVSFSKNQKISIFEDGIRSNGFFQKGSFFSAALDLARLEITDIEAKNGLFCFEIMNSDKPRKGKFWIDFQEGKMKKVEDISYLLVKEKITSANLKKVIECTNKKIEILSNSGEMIPANIHLATIIFDDVFLEIKNMKKFGFISLDIKGKKRTWAGILPDLENLNYIIKNNDLVFFKFKGGSFRFINTMTEIAPTEEDNFLSVDTPTKLISSCLSKYPLLLYRYCSEDVDIITSFGLDFFFPPKNFNEHIRNLLTIKKISYRNNILYVEFEIPYSKRLGEIGIEPTNNRVVNIEKGAALVELEDFKITNERLQREAEIRATKQKATP
jgi:hypothetical protein